jgi:hypothetical protein
MDAIFAILVLGAVIFFGALISAGNERQRKALEGIREQAAQWAMQDLRLKREHLAREVKVDDPVAWLNRVVTRVVGEDLGLVVTEVLETPQALVCTAKNGGKVIFSPAASHEIGKMKQKRSNKLSQIGKFHPLMNLPRGVIGIELSVLTSGIMFDLELPIAWQALVGKVDGLGSSIWVYIIE